MFGLGTTELLLLFAIALLLFGVKRLPGLGRALGQGVAGFRKAGAELKAPLKAVKGEAEQQPK